MGERTLMGWLIILEGNLTQRRQGAKAQRIAGRYEGGIQAISGGFCLCQSVLCSKAWAILKIVSSPKGSPSSCRPIGNFGALVNPHGMLRPQMPARLAEMVKMSIRYI